MKKKIIIGTIGIFILSFLFHSIYSKMPNFLFSIIAPVNESIWEHGKMILSSFVVWMFIERLAFKDRTNVVSSLFLASIICIILEYLIFTPFFLYILKAKENMPATLIIYAICIIISLWIREKYLRKEENLNSKYMSVFGIIGLYIVFTILSYNPLKYPIFYDYNKEIYGIPSR